MTDPVWLSRLQLILCTGKKEKTQPTGVSLEPAALERQTDHSWTIHSSVGHPFMRAEFKLLAQIYSADPGHSQCITNPRLLLEIKERFV